jgi:hypothetical protein
VLERARGKSKAQVEELAAELWPRPDAPTFVRRLPPPMPRGPAAAGVSAASAAVSPTPGGEPRPAGLTAVAPGTPALRGPDAGWSGVSPGSSWGAAPTGSSDSPPPGSLGASPGPLTPPAAAATATLSGATVTAASPAAERPSPRRAAEVTPLSPDRYRVQVTIGTGTLEKLRLAKDLLRHSVPSGDEAVILDRALTALLEDIARRQCAATPSPRPAPGATSGSRHVPAEVRRRVWLRDAARCAFVGTGGRRCSERSFLEFHHVKPFALGGETTLENVQLRCRSHNAYEARLYFAPDGNGGADLVREAAAPRDLESTLEPAASPRAVAAPASVVAARRSTPPADRRAPTRSGTSRHQGRDATPRSAGRLASRGEPRERAP